MSIYINYKSAKHPVQQKISNVDIRLQILLTREEQATQMPQHYWVCDW